MQRTRAMSHAEEGWLLPCIRSREDRSLCRPLPQRQPHEGRLQRFVRGELERACSRPEKGDGNENERCCRCREESGELCGCEGGDHGSLGVLRLNHEEGRILPPGPKLRTPSHMTRALEGRMPQRMS